MINNDLLDEIFKCPICYSILEDPVTTICGHNFCYNCIKRSNGECPYCRKKLKMNELTINYQIKNDLEKIKYFKEQQNRKTFTPVKNNSIKFFENSSANGKNSNVFKKKRKYNEINSAPVISKKFDLMSYKPIKLEYSEMMNDYLLFTINQLNQIKNCDIFNIYSNNQNLYLERQDHSEMYSSDNITIKKFKY